MRKVLKVAIVLVVTYSLLLAGFYIAMGQRPVVFARLMSKTPDLVFIVFPFKTMWLSARRGNLYVGSETPGFSLTTFDQTSSLQLSSLKGIKPEVLVFGSYT